MCRRATGIRRQKDRHRHGHPAEAGEDWQRDAAPLPQLPHVELAARLQPDDEEEERHQPAVHPAAKIERYARAGDVDRELRPPEVFVGRRVDVDPHERHQRRGKQERRATDLCAKEPPQRCLEAAGPGRPLRERPACGPGLSHLLLVPLDDLRRARRRCVRIPAGLTERAPLAQQIPALVE